MRRTADKVAEEAGKEQLRSYEHCGKSYVEPWRVGNQPLRYVVDKGVHLVGTYQYYRDETYEEHYGAEEAENVHRLLAEGAEEPQCKEVEVAVDKPVQSHELRLTVFACLMLHHLLAYLVEACVLCQIRYIPVHFAIYLDILHHILPVGFQTTVEVVQVLDAAYLPCRGIEKLCRYRL